MQKRLLANGSLGFRAQEVKELKERIEELEKEKKKSVALQKEMHDDLLVLRCICYELTGIITMPPQTCSRDRMRDEHFDEHYSLTQTSSDS